MCDSFSILQVTLALLGGGALLLATTQPTQNRQIISLGIGGVLGAAALLILFPECLRSPYADITPLAKQYWLDHVSDTWSVNRLILSDPLALVKYFGLPITSLCLCIFAITKGYEVKSASLLAIIISVSIVFSTLQTRGIMFMITVSLLPMIVAVVIARARAVSIDHNRSFPALAMSIYIASFAPFWTMADYIRIPLQTFLASNAATAKTTEVTSLTNSDVCAYRHFYSVLASEPKGVVLSGSALAPLILAYTHHRAIASPFHRNTDGFELLVKIMTGNTEEAQTLVRANGITHIAACWRGQDLELFRETSPNGFNARFYENPDKFDWLEVIPETKDEPLRIFRVVDP